MRKFPAIIPFHSTSVLEKFFIAILCLFLIKFSNAQDTTNSGGVIVRPGDFPALDSMKLVLTTLPGNEEKMNLYGKICWFLLGKSAYGEAKLYADSVYLLSQKLQSEEGRIKAVYYYGVMDRLTGKSDSALYYMNQYIDYYQSQNDSGRVARGLYQVGVIQADLGNYEKSLAAYYKAIAINQDLNDQYSVGFTLNSIGVILSETKKYPDAERVYTRALKIFDSLDEKSDKTNVLVNLGNLYTATGRLAEAKKKYEDALIIDREIKKEHGIALSLANIAFLFDKSGQYDSALTYHLAGLAIRERLPNKEDIGRSLIGVGLGHLRLKNYSPARAYLTRALELVNEIGSKPMLQDTYQNLSELNAAEGNFAEAFRFYKLYTQVKDSVFGETNARQLAELQTKYETSEKDKQISLLANERLIQQKETERQAVLKKIFIAGLIAVSILVLLLIYIFRERIKSQRTISQKNDEIREIDFRRQMSELEMKALRAQINPHFLFNCMNSINRMILDGETESASVYLTKFSKLVRLILENAEVSSVSLQNELDLLESYIQLEALRFKGKISYNIFIDKSIVPENTYMPSMVLQPFVENAIWHGLMHKEGNHKGVINIAVKEEKDQLLCTIEDNGVGRKKAEVMREQSLMKRKSMGMKITEDRLKMLSSQDSEIIRVFDLTDSLQQATGTRVEVNVPLM